MSKTPVLYLQNTLTSSLNPVIGFDRCFFDAHLRVVIFVPPAQGAAVRATLAGCFIKGNE
jgi:hypothetical protein